MVMWDGESMHERVSPSELYQRAQAVDAWPGAPYASDIEYSTSDQVDGELCGVCQERYRTVYRLPDPVWDEISGGVSLLCPKCADKRARALDIELCWEATVGAYPLAGANGLDAAAMQALWTIIWHTGYMANLNIAGTHMNYDVVDVAGYRFEGEWYIDIAPRLVAWAELLRHRQPNMPLPEPPAAVTGVTGVAEAMNHELRPE